MILGFIDGALQGRLIAIVVLTLVSGGSFALGYHVGKSDTPETPQVIRDYPRAHAPAIEELPQTETATPAPEEIADIEEEKVIEEKAIVEQEPRALKPAVELEVKKAEPRTEANETKKTAQPKTFSGKPFTVQAGVFSEKRYAESFAAKLKRKGYGAFIENASGNEKTIYRVKVGWFRSRDEAAAEAARLKREEGLETFVTGPK